MFVAIHDIAGRTRGKAFPAGDFEGGRRGTVGWTPTNVQITCFDAIAPSPFGALGDLLLVPDPETRVELCPVDDRAAERFMIADITTLEGAPWSCCTRSILKGALERLQRVAGVTLMGAFEHEFQLTNEPPLPTGGYSLAGFRAEADFCEELMAAIGAARLTPDTIMKEYGPNQFEVTVGPERGVRIADAATIVRELTQALAARKGDRATFTPIRDPASVGNGAHIHFTLLDADGKSVNYDPAGRHGMSAVFGAFIAGILKYLDRIVAFTAPSVISYQRLTPHRWSAAYNNLGFRDREAAVRICPVATTEPDRIARQFHAEFRAGDCAAAPHLALAAIVHAGVQGIEEGLEAPAATEEDLAAATSDSLAARGLVRLPTSLAAALDRLEGCATVRGWFAPEFVPIYLAHKRGEIAHVEGLDAEALHAAYDRVY
ncbi:type I glutamate--ammonia ligase [Acuticoccus mangrovi]